MENEVLLDEPREIPRDEQQCPRCNRWFHVPELRCLIPCTPDSNLHRIVLSKGVNWTIRDFSCWPPKFIWKDWPEREYQIPDGVLESRILSLSSTKKKIFKKYLDAGFDRRPALALARNGGWL